MEGHITVGPLLKQCPSIYKLVLLASKRAKELAEGERPLVERRYRKVTMVALDEIVAGKVSYKDAEELSAEATKKGKAKKKA
jgi:DNA-directed RNA polymerase subunit omega